MKMVDKSTKLDKFTANSGGNAAVGNSGINISSNAATTSTAMTHHHQNGQKPVPMKLFAAWEVDRTPPNCIPR